MVLPRLIELLDYQNPRVIKLYEQNYPNNKLTAEQAFTEMLKYLWLTQKHALDMKNLPNSNDLPSDCVMLRSMREIDEMWHEFILFTEDYTSFCNEYFGAYLHHLPNIFDNMPIPSDMMDDEISKLLPYIYDNLGEATMRVWFADYIIE